MELGAHPAFDDAFMVKCEDASATRLAWTDEARDLMLEHLRMVRVESDGSVVSIIGLGAYVERARVEAMLDLAGALASYGACELEKLSDIPDARFVPTGGAWEAPRRPALRIASKAGDVDVRVLVAAGSPLLQLALGHDRDMPTFSADLLDGEVSGLPRGLLPEGAGALLRPIGRATLVNERRQGLKLTWPEPAEKAAVVAGVKLLAALAEGSRSQGAFR